MVKSRRLRKNLGMCWPELELGLESLLFPSCPAIVQEAPRPDLSLQLLREVRV